MKVVVGSASQYKVRAVEVACARVFSDTSLWVEVIGTMVSSGVSPQPMSTSECIRGARNRARAAITNGEVDLAIGIENGLVEVEGRWFATTWIVAVDAAGAHGIASTLMRPVPAPLIDLVLQGFELSDAIRRHYGEVDRSGSEGLIGLITAGVLQKQPVLVDGIIAALAPLVNREMFT